MFEETEMTALSIWFRSAQSLEKGLRMDTAWISEARTLASFHAKMSSNLRIAAIKLFLSNSRTLGLSDFRTFGLSDSRTFGLSDSYLACAEASLYQARISAR